MILDAIWETLKIKGRFLVTTCSILPQENEHQIRKFLDRHSDAALVQIEDVPNPYTIWNPEFSFTYRGRWLLLLASG